MIELVSFGCFYISSVSLSYRLATSESRRRSSDTTSHPRTSTDDTLMDSGFHTVEHFQVQLWKLVFLIGRSFFDISKRRSIHNVSDNETLDCLVLGDSLAGGNTTDTLNVSASLLVASVISSLDRHFVSV